MQTSHLSPQDVFQHLQRRQAAHFAGYLAMYSSWYGGIVTDPTLMLLPIDDHMVHRGDGVFEAIKVVNGGVWLLEAHLNRLFLSASRIFLDLPWSKEQIRETILQTCRVAAKQAQEILKLDPAEFSAIVRLYISRG